MDVTLGTFHWNRYYMYELIKYDFNEFNPGFILYRKDEDWKVGGGIVLNSYHRVSYLVGVGKDISPKVSMVGGLITGYGKTDVDKSLLPMVMATYRIGRFKLGVSPAFLMGMMSFKL